MAISKGIVDAINERTVNTKYGAKPVYDVMIDGVKHSWGFKKPATLGVKPGTEIQFDVLMDKFGPKITEGSVTVLSQGNKVGLTPVVTSHIGTGGGAAFPVATTSREYSIIRQNALTNAREMVSLLWEGSKADPLTDADMAERIITMANIFADYSSGQREVKAAEIIVKGRKGKGAKFLNEVAEEEVEEVDEAGEEAAA